MYPVNLTNLNWCSYYLDLILKMNIILSFYLYIHIYVVLIFELYLFRYWKL